MLVNYTIIKRYSYVFPFEKFISQRCLNLTTYIHDVERRTLIQDDEEICYKNVKYIMEYVVYQLTKLLEGKAH